MKGDSQIMDHFIQHKHSLMISSPYYIQIKFCTIC